MYSWANPFCNKYKVKTSNMPRLGRLKSFYIARLPEVLGSRTGRSDPGFVPNESEQMFWPSPGPGFRPRASRGGIVWLSPVDIPSEWGYQGRIGASRGSLAGLEFGEAPIR